MQRNWSQDSYIKAYQFVARAHLGQKVPGTELPYLVHLSHVSIEIIAALNTHADCDGELAVQCALLHDVIEDTPTTYAQIVKKFGAAVADGVQALSKDKAVAEPLRMADSLRKIRQQPKEVWMVKLADRITNLQPPPSHWTQEKIVHYRDEAIDIHKALGEASSFLSQRLLTRIDDYRVYIRHE